MLAVNGQSNVCPITTQHIDSVRMPSRQLVAVPDRISPNFFIFLNNEKQLSSFIPVCTHTMITQRTVNHSKSPSFDSE